MLLAVEELGLVGFDAARALQLERIASRLRGDIPDTLLLLEHPPVITLGRGTDPANVLCPDGIPVVETERGGDVTLHAPGQTVGYLIRRLEEGNRDLRAHLRLCEEIVILALRAFRIDGQRVPGRTGVWVGGRKIASLGVACRSWCTWHGFALNVGIDLSLFRAVNPCGLEASVMTSLDREGGRRHEPAEVRRALALAAGSLLDPEHSAR